jgi:hypothetical protein
MMHLFRTVPWIAVATVATFAVWACVSDEAAPIQNLVIDGGTLPDSAIVCDPGTTPCGQTCANLMTDPQNCGKCGRVCGATCSPDGCATILLGTLNPDVETPVGLAVDDKNIYISTWWSGPVGPTFEEQQKRSYEGNIYYKPKDQPGATFTLIAANQSMPTVVARVGDRLVWGSWYYNGGIRSVQVAPLVQVGAANIAEHIYGPFNFYGVATHGAEAFFVSRNQGGQTDGRLYSVDFGDPLAPKTDAGAIAAVARVEGQLESRDVAADQSRIYWGYKNGIRSIPRDAGVDAQATELTGGLLQSDGLALTTTHLYFSDRGAGKLFRVRTDGKQLEELASSLKSPENVVADGDFVYVAEPDGGRITRVRISTKEVTRFVVGLDKPVALAVDDTYLYWAEATKVGKIAK